MVKAITAAVLVLTLAMTGQAAQAPKLPAPRAKAEVTR